MSELYVNNDNVVKLTGVKNVLTGQYVDNATVQLTLLDSSGSNVTGETWPVTMSYISSSNGDYQYTVPASISVVSGKTYQAKVSVTISGLTGEFNLSMRAVERFEG